MQAGMGTGACREKGGKFGKHLMHLIWGKPRRKRGKRGREGVMAYIASISSSRFQPCSELIGTAFGIRYKRSSSSIEMLSILLST